MPYVVGAIVSLALVFGIGCSEFNNARGRGDAPVGVKDDSSAEVINMPDLFANMATKCNHGNRLYATTREAAPVVVPADPTCPQVGQG